jgi:CheY-like chemotaxis protein
MDEPRLQTKTANVTSRRVLIVDDSRDTAGLFKALLKIEGYEARTAFDGPEAIEAAKLHCPHVVLLDLMLPTMGGVAVAQALRGVPELSQCHIIAVSGYGGDRITQPSPFDLHLTKPVDPDTLLKLLAEMTAEGPKALVDESVLTSRDMPA